MYFCLNVCWLLRIMAVRNKPLPVAHRLVILGTNVLNNMACCEQVYSMWSSHAGDYGSQSVSASARMSRWLGPALERLQFSHGKVTPVLVSSLPFLLCPHNSRKMFYKPIRKFGKRNALLTDCTGLRTSAAACRCQATILRTFICKFIDQYCHLLWYCRTL